MNDDKRISDIDSNAERTPAPSRCDNYERYLEDAYGYAYSARDIVSMTSLERHDELADSPDLAQVEVSADELDDFERVGLARGKQKAGDLEGFAAELDRLLASDDHHPAVAYVELPLLAAEVLRSHEMYERAEQFLDRAIDRWPDHAIAARQHKALVALASEGPDTAQTRYEQLADDHPDDPELRFEIAEDLWRYDQPELAMSWSQRAESTAERVGDHSILVDIELLKERLDRREAADDDEPEATEG